MLVKGAPDGRGTYYWLLPYAHPDSKVHGSNMGPIWGRQDPGGRLNKKDGLSRYGDSHVKDKTS